MKDSNLQIDDYFLSTDENLKTCCSPVSHKKCSNFYFSSFEFCEQENTQVSVKQCFIKNLIYKNFFKNADRLNYLAQINCIHDLTKFSPSLC